MLNRIKDEVRWASRRPGSGDELDLLQDPSPSPLENAVGADVLERYERALETLDPGDRELLHLRIELGFDYHEIAGITGRASRDAVRMAVQRALARLAEAMGHDV